jgi:hypothetical protein
MITICPHCKSNDQYPDSYANQECQCRNCGRYFKLPKPMPVAAARKEPVQNFPVFPRSLEINIKSFDMPFGNILWMSLKLAMAAFLVSIIPMFLWFVLLALFGSMAL